MAGLLDSLQDALYTTPKAYWGDKAKTLASLLSDSATAGAGAYGSASQPLKPEYAKTLAGLLADFTPVVGDVKSAYDGYQAAREGDYLGASLGALGALPFVPNMAGITKNAGDWLHGSDKVFDEFKVMPGRNPALFFSPVSDVSRKTQAEHIAEGPFGGQLYSVGIDNGKKFDPLNDPQAAELYKKTFPNRDVRQWVEYPDIYIDSPLIQAMNKHGYNRVRVHEPSVQGFSEAVIDPALIKILEREAVKK